LNIIIICDDTTVLTNSLQVHFHSSLRLMNVKNIIDLPSPLYVRTRMFEILLEQDGDKSLLLLLLSEAQGHERSKHRRCRETYWKAKRNGSERAWERGDQLGAYRISLIGPSLKTRSACVRLDLQQRGCVAGKKEGGVTCGHVQEAEAEGDNDATKSAVRGGGQIPEGEAT
jgi:hypothetical protein